MSKIDQQMVNAILERRNWHRGNRGVRVFDTEIQVTLWGNLIAVIRDDTVLIRHCGYETRLTAKVLEAILSIYPSPHPRVYIRNFRMYTSFSGNTSEVLPLMFIQIPR